MRTDYASQAGSLEITERRFYNSGTFNKAARFLGLNANQLKKVLGNPSEQGLLKPTINFQGLDFVATELGWKLSEESLARIPQPQLYTEPVNPAVLSFAIPASMGVKPAQILIQRTSPLSDSEIKELQTTLTSERLKERVVVVRYVSLKGETLQREAKANEIRISNDSTYQDSLGISLEFPLSNKEKQKHHEYTSKTSGLQALAIWTKT